MTERDVTAGFTVYKADVRVVAFCCDVVLHARQDLSSIPDAVLHVYESFLRACPAGRLRWYSTENMQRDKPVTPRAIEMLRGWLRAGAPARKMINIHLKDGATFADAPEYSFWVYGSEQGDLGHGEDANTIRCTFPGELGLMNPDWLFEFATYACTYFPFFAGHAGLVLETSPYDLRGGHVPAFRLSMQHPGLDISNVLTESTMVRRDGIASVNWLTMLGPDFIERLGGISAIRSKLPDAVGIVPVGTGIVLRAGPTPRWGHVNRQDLLPEYRAVYHVVASLQEPIVQRYTSFSLPGGDHKEKTTAWLRRFADGV